MTTTYKADLALTYNATYSENGYTNPWGGVTGILRAMSEVTAGDSIHVFNDDPAEDNQNLVFLMKIPVASTANISVDDVLVDTTADPDAAIRVAVVVTDDYVLGEYIVAGYGGDFANGHTVTTDGGVTTTTIDAAPSYCGLLFDSDFVADGTEAAPITMAGFAADQTTPESAYLDSASVAAGIYIDGVEYWHLDHIHIERPVGAGLDVLNAAHKGWALDYVTTNLASANGLYNVTDLNQAHLRHCGATNCTSHGLYTTPLYGEVRFCEFIGNGSSGIMYGDRGAVADTVCHGNGSNGIYASSVGGLKITNCVCDSNTANGISVSTGADSIVVHGCCLSRNGQHPIYTADVNGLYLSDYNAFWANNDDELYNIEAGDHDITLTADPYEDSSADDFRLTVSAGGRRTEVELETPSSAFVSSGLTADDSTGAYVVYRQAGSPPAVAVIDPSDSTAQVNAG